MTPRPFATRTTLTALSTVALFGLAACADGEDSADTGAADGNGETTEETRQGALEAPLDEVVIAQGEAPGEGHVEPIDPARFEDQVAALEEAQAREKWDDEGCDHATRIRTVTNYVATDGVTRVVMYRDPEDAERRHQFPVAVVGEELEEFMDRSVYEACSEATNTDNPAYRIRMFVVDAPEIEGAEGFRVVTDIIGPDPTGAEAVKRTVSIHGQARGVTTAVEYQADGHDLAADPVSEDANMMLDNLYRLQMEKILDA